MTENPLIAIRRLFIDRYDDLKARLERRMGRSDLVGDAMHDTWLRLVHTDTVGVVQSPDNYLFRAILNAAEDRRRREKHHRTTVGIEDALEVRDEAATPEEVLLAQVDLKAFQLMIAELPERRRAIFLAARFGNMPRQEIADRLGISRRSVAREILLAHKHCLRRRKELRD